MHLTKSHTSRTFSGISTASLADIVFILLFFFMVVTVLREDTLRLQIVTPEVTELTRLTNTSLVMRYYIGRPMDGRAGEQVLLQLGDKIASVDDIARFQYAKESTTPESLHPLMTASLVVDQQTPMGMVEDVKTALRKVNQLKISYAANKRQ